MSKWNVSKKYINSLIIGIFILSLIYIVARALTIDTVIDEAKTLSTYVPMGYRDILFSIESASTANNHILNTLFIKLLLSLFNSATYTYFIARIPNILAFIVYAFTLYKLFEKQDCFKRVAGTVILINPFILEFFGYARGYGLALSLFIFAIYIVNIETKKQLLRKFIAILIFSLAVYANLTMIYAFVPFIIYILILDSEVIRSWKKVRNIYEVMKKWLLENWSLILLTVVTISFMLYRIYLLMKTHSLYDGTDQGYIYGTWGFIVRAFSYNNTLHVYGYIIALLLLSLVIGFSIYKLIGKKDLIKEITLNMLLIFIVPLEMFIAGVLLDSLFPMARAAYYMFIPLVLFIVLYDASNRLIKIISNLILGVLFITTILIDLNHLRLSESYYWKYDINSLKIASVIDLLDRTDNIDSVIAVDWLLDESLMYHKGVNEYSYNTVLLGRSDILRKYLFELPPQYVVTLEYRHLGYMPENINYIRDNYEVVYNFDNNDVLIWKIKE